MDRACSNCGRALEPSMNYCPTCGVTLEGKSAASSPTTSRRAPSRSGDRSGVDPAVRKRLEARVAAATRDGWRLERDLGDRAIVVRRTVGTATEHLVVAALTIWWTMGIGNALYGAYRYLEDAERLVIRADRPGPEEDADGDSRGRLLGRATAALCWLTGAILAFIGLQLSAFAPSLVLSVLAVGFGLLGVATLPSVADRLARRRSPLVNGRIRSVEERSVVDYERPCTACAEPVGRGIERIYRDEFRLLGVPLTGSAGRNRYCRQCANAEPTPDRTATGSTTTLETDRE